MQHHARAADAGGETAVSVLIDARTLTASGLGRYLREVLKEILIDPRFARITLMGDLDVLGPFVTEHAAERIWPIQLLSYPSALYSAEVQFAWLRLRATGRVDADVSFFPHYDTPAVGFSVRSVVTVHDLIHFELPELFPRWRRTLAGTLLRRTVKNAARVITGSRATQRDLVRRVPAAEAKLELIPYGVSTLTPSESGGAAAPAADLPAPPYLLCVGNRKPHKNWVAAVETLALLREHWPDLRLVFVGRVFPGWESVLQRADALGVRGAVLDLGQVTDAELDALFRRCEALLFPSLYEGFGLPVLEAMTCGAPVVASNRGALPEAVGNAGLLVEPHDYSAMADAIRRLTHDPDLRQRLVRRGRKWAAQHSWQRTARRTADLLLHVATEPSRVRDVRRASHVPASASVLSASSRGWTGTSGRRFRRTT